MKKGLRILGITLLIAGLPLLAFYAMNQPVQIVSETRILEIPQGVPFSQVADLLKSQHLLANTWFFSAIARIKGQDRKIIPGEYELHTGMRPTEILAKLVAGRVFHHSVTVPEGYTIAQIAQVLGAKELTDQTEFLRLTRDRDLIERLGLQVSSLEGYLFPDTYFFIRPTAPEEIIRTLVDRFWKMFSLEYQSRTKELNMTIQEVLTLASVIEKETGLSKERALVSGVFHNRLRQNIPLQSDPTVIYALEEFDGNIRKKDLMVESPYNTYLVVGLPPGPIANPGEAAIRAALFPTATEFFYFVSRNDGSHEFSVTLAEHNEAVEKYQRSQRKQSS